MTEAGEQSQAPQRIKQPEEEEEEEEDDRASVYSVASSLPGKVATKVNQEDEKQRVCLCAVMRMRLLGVGGGVVVLAAALGVGEEVESLGRAVCW